jgi:serine/threonine-protein kinase RsbW
VEEISRMSLWLDYVMCQLGLADSLRFKFDLCASEAVTNIISYAYPDAGVHEISLRLRVADTVVALQIEDDGIAFNPLAIPDHVQPGSLEEAEIGGLGIGLMRGFMDECRYQRCKDRNVLTLISHISGPAT